MGGEGVVQAGVRGGGVRVDDAAFDVVVFEGEQRSREGALLLLLVVGFGGRRVVGEFVIGAGGGAAGFGVLGGLGEGVGCKLGRVDEDEELGRVWVDVADEVGEDGLGCV